MTIEMIASENMKLKNELDALSKAQEDSTDIKNAAVRLRAEIRKLR